MMMSAAQDKTKKELDGSSADEILFFSHEACIRFASSTHSCFSVIRYRRYKWRWHEMKGATIRVSPVSLPASSSLESVFLHDCWVAGFLCRLFLGPRTLLDTSCLLIIWLVCCCFFLIATIVMLRAAMDQKTIVCWVSLLWNLDWCEQI